MASARDYGDDVGSSNLRLNMPGACHSRPSLVGYLFKRKVARKGFVGIGYLPRRLQEDPNRLLKDRTQRQIRRDGQIHALTGARNLYGQVSEAVTRVRTATRYD